ncbi:MAG TPA: type I-U CRISPR-associated helicase/endonuclease Cas3, partial [Lacipirellulaceae bacterium]|nr:type I-U CRISPR-associated helicase/endonuclease Cas3 [Lacipirellulaceae bacterium]
LQVAQLRGGVFRDRAWAQSIVQPIVVCTTADQLGSRLLFRGYGVSDSMKPVHAALCACDSVILLDEAHVTKAFAQTLRLIERYQQHRPGIRFVEMTATPSVEPKSRLALSEDDLAHPVLKCRQLAHKPAALVKVNAKALVTEIVKQAIGAVNDDERKAVGIIVNRVQTARDVYAKLREFHPDATHLVIGRMRPIDRDDLQTQLRNIVGPSRPEVLPADHKPVFVVATQCLEVGADYDFDALITECASLDALRQRFGRLNRRGREYADKSPFETVAFILATDDSLKGGDPIYEDAIKHTWEWLQSKKDAGDQVNFGIAAFKPLWDAADDDTRKLLLSPSRDAAVLLPAHLDALCQTSPQPIPSPDVSYFIHGSRRDMAEVNVCWRADLGDDRTEWPDAVRLLPPTSPECMTVPLVAVRKWMGETLRAMPEADVPTLPPEVEERRNASEPSASQWVLRWRGSKQVETTSDPRDIAPGDTVVLPATYCNWNELGHIPGAPSANELARQKDEDDRAYEQRRRSLLSKVDLAERATRESRLRLVLRLHDHFPDRRDLRGLPTAELRAKLTSLLDAELDGRPERDTVLAALDSRFDRHLYREPDADAPAVKL